MTRKFRVGILGATGMVGQRFIQLLENHPQFEITALAASDRSQGKSFQDACAWRLAGEMPQGVKSMTVAAPRPPLDCELIFSSLPGDIARGSEGAFAGAGFPVISNSSAFRMEADVPLLIPEVNAEHLALLDVQRKNSPGQQGYVVTNPNCSTIMLALALAPLHQKFGVSSVVVTTMQALSGAGYPGVASLAISDNVLPFIESEEEKMEQETLKRCARFIHGVTTKTSASLRTGATDHCARRIGSPPAAAGSRCGKWNERHYRSASAR